MRACKKCNECEVFTVGAIVPHGVVSKYMGRRRPTLGTAAGALGVPALSSPRLLCRCGIRLRPLDQPEEEDVSADIGCILRLDPDRYLFHSS